MIPFWIFIIVLIMTSTIVIIGFFVIIKFIERKSRVKWCNELHRQNNSKSYWDDIEGDQKEDDIPFINVREDLEITMKRRLRLEEEARDVRVGLRRSLVFKRGIHTFTKSNLKDEITLNIDRENKNRSMIEGGLEILKESKVDVNEIEEYILDLGPPEEWV